MTENTQAEEGEVKIESTLKTYWNSKTSGYAKPGDQIKGVLLRVEADTYKDKPTTNYVLRNVEDDYEVVLPNHAVLNGLMVKVPVGKTVRVVYRGKSEKSSRGRNAPELYDVYLSPGPAQEVQKNLAAVMVKEPDMAEYMPKIIKELKYGSDFFVDGIIPEEVVLSRIAFETNSNDTSANKKLIQKMKDRGMLVYWENSKGKGYKAIT